MLEALATFAVLSLQGLHRAGIAGFITILAETTAIQLVVAVAARRMGATAREAARVTQREAAVREQATIAERLRAARQARWLSLQETAGPLLRALAAGTADPADPQVRQACAVEAARLRLLMAESDDAPGPLMHEIQACADIAERRGVAVDIETVGALPGVPAEVRRVITDTAIALLTTAASQVRVTLTALPEGVAVSLVADSPALPAAARGRPWGRGRARARLPQRVGGGPVDQRMRVTAGIVEDHPVVIEGITSWISADPEERIQVVLVAHDLMALEPVTGPVADVIILDLELNGKLVTSQLARLVAAGNRIVAFSAHADPGLVRDVLDGGAHAYVAKDEGREYLVEAVLAAAADRPCVTRSQAKAFLGDTGPGRPSLSVQERQALLLWFQGMSKASVGRRMSITENTVRQYIDRARMKYAALGRPGSEQGRPPGPRHRGRHHHPARGRHVHLPGQPPGLASRPSPRRARSPARALVPGRVSAMLLP